MIVPTYWLPRPQFDLSPAVALQLEALHTRYVMPGSGAWLPEPLPVPRWLLCCWLADEKKLLLHGSGDPAITEFEPRPPNDRSADDFSKQTAVFAASDGIWPIFYAILDRSRFRLRMLNGALQFEIEPGRLTGMHYFFSITAGVLQQQPWREGILYLLPREGFRQQPPYRFGGRIIHEPHWARTTPVRPLAKLRVTPKDFPFLAQVRGHDDDYIMARAAEDPEGFPWID